MALKYRPTGNQNQASISPSGKMDALLWPVMILYGIIFMILCSIAGFIFSVNNLHLQGNYRVFIPAVVFLLLGVLFCITLGIKLPFLTRANFLSGFIYTLVLCLLIGTLLSVIAAFTSRQPASVSIFYSTLFFLPYTIYQGWLFYKSLSPVIAPWYIPDGMSEIPSATIFLNSIQLIIKISTRQQEPEYAHNTVAPGRVSLGKMFYDFITEEKDANEHTIEMNTDNGIPFGWFFYASSLGGISKRQLNAERNLDENGLKSGSIVIARRSL